MRVVRFALPFRPSRPRRGRGPVERRGKVATQAGAPIQGLPVIIENDANQSVAITDEEGNFDAPVPRGEGSKVILPTPGAVPTVVPPVGASPVSVGSITIALW